MLANEYDAFVRRTNLNLLKARETQEDIAIYGLVGEMGSLASAVKRRLIADGGGELWTSPNSEIVEELGDSLWYWSVLAQLYSIGTEAILRKDPIYVRSNLGRRGKKGQRFRESVGPDRVKQFRLSVRRLLQSPEIDFDSYQNTAYLTRRTEGQTLIGVCLTVLSQLGSELLRKKFPAVENEINTTIENRSEEVILGEIAWHLAAIASAFELRLGDIARINEEKIDRRLNNTTPTPSHDERDPSHERFPRQFDVSFVMVERDKTRMYLNGRQLGDELSDNAYSDDGYRFHDVMHLAGVANLGWSPVLRGLLHIKRKSSPKKDEVEDGARAKIVEEAVIKAIHSEGQRIASQRANPSAEQPARLIESRSEISFRFLGFIANLTKGLEVEKNQYWEWENAIIQGNDIFWQLRREQQGTVSVDLDARKITFIPDVYIDGPGTIVGLGSAVVDGSIDTPLLRQPDRRSRGSRQLEVPKRVVFSGGREAAVKRAILAALNLEPDPVNLDNLCVRPFRTGISVKANADVRAAMWARKVISFRTTLFEQESMVTCVATAIA